MKDRNFLESHGVNVSKSLELFGDMETYNSTLNDFLADVPGKLADIKKYKETSDMANYAILVHSLKSDAKYFGFEKLADLAYQHELQSKANDMYYVVEHFDELMEEAKKIIRLVQQYLGQEIAIIQEEEKKEIKDKTILIVDYTNIVRNFIQKIFDDSYDVMIANDGAEAINIINQNLESKKIVGVLLDLNMPNVDGFEVLDYFKQHNLFLKIPVSIITGEGSKEMIERAFKYPIVDCLIKPFNERDIKRIVERTIVFHESM